MFDSKSVHLRQSFSFAIIRCLFSLSDYFCNAELRNYLFKGLRLLDSEPTQAITVTINVAVLQLKISILEMLYYNASFINHSQLVKPSCQHVTPIFFNFSTFSQICKAQLFNFQSNLQNCTIKLDLLGVELSLVP